LPESKRGQLGSDLDQNPALKSAIETNPDLLDRWRILDTLAEITLRADITWLKRVSDWNGAGVQLSKSGNNLKLSDSSGNTLGEFLNGNLIPENSRYDFPVNPASSAVGDVVNGYQVYKDGGGVLSIRRVPDRSPYSASEITDLTQLPNAHVLERHGHDVPDEALLKRAQSPSHAPDGKLSNNAPPHSSKFISPEDLREGLHNTKPGTPAFINGVQQGSRRIVTYTSTNVLGKGVPSNGNYFVDMKKVTAIYKNVGGGNYQLITMYPSL